MFGHRVSKIGYILSAIGAVLVFLVTVFGRWVFAASDTGDMDAMNNVVLVANIASAIGTWMTIAGVVMIICGVLARGFERVEAAVLSCTPVDKK